VATIIELENIVKTYELKSGPVPALKGISLSLQEDEFVAIMGASGSGKSTLLNIIGCLHRPTSGKYHLNQKSVANLSDHKLSEIRNQEIGFIFQSFHLVPQFNALENVMLPLKYAGVSRKEQRHRATELLKSVGLGDRLTHLPAELSGGQQQRVAVARAMVTNPKILLADEPTGNLDSDTSHDMMDLFTRLNDKGMAIVLVTHERDIVKYAKRKIVVKDGGVISDET